MTLLWQVVPISPEAVEKAVSAASSSGIPSIVIYGIIALFASLAGAIGVLYKALREESQRSIDLVLSQIEVLRGIPGLLERHAEESTEARKAHEQIIRELLTQNRETMKR